jgi:uncharacterized protein with HEPN domain
MQPEDLIRLRHMLDAARTATRFARERGRTDLGADELASHGLVRLIEIVGEAAARVSPDARAELAELPWPAMIGMRNRLVHGYYDVDMDRVWDTLVHDLPPLVAVLERHLSQRLGGN